MTRRRELRVWDAGWPADHSCAETARRCRDQPRHEWCSPPRGRERAFVLVVAPPPQVGRAFGPAFGRWPARPRVTTPTRFNLNSACPTAPLQGRTRRDLPLLAKRFACLGRSCARALVVVFALVWRDSTLIFFAFALANCRNPSWQPSSANNQTGMDKYSDRRMNMNRYSRTQQLNAASSCKYARELDL
jgi:hypothetical protein